MNEWQYKPIDWSKEDRCTHCRMPPVLINDGNDKSYVQVTCRACEFIRIFNCKECDEEIGYCENVYMDNPPTSKLDMKRKCIRYEKRIP